MKSKKNSPAKKVGNKKLVEKAGLAIKHEFYLEAALVLSSLFERKLDKILDKLQPASLRQGLTYSQSIKRVKHLLVNSKDPELNGQLNVELIDEIRNWKNQRNEILKDIPEIHVSQARVERLANEGVKLYKEFNKAAKTLKQADGLSDSNDEG